jgi:hypothetical protein
MCCRNILTLSVICSVRSHVCRVFFSLLVTLVDLIPWQMLYVCMCVCVFMYVYMCVCIYIYIYIYCDILGVSIVT